MMKFSALNESSLSDDDGDPELATREAQEEEAYALYHQALKKQSEAKIEDSEKMFKDVLKMEFVTRAQLNDEKEEGPLGPALTLKYLVYKNLAIISNEKQDYHAAITFFLEALEIDATDVSMWYRMGKASLNISNYSLARLCFEEGLKCNPNHWPCLDNVITVMYTLNDYANCLYYIAQGLERECYYLKGLVFKDRIYHEDPSLKSFCESYFKKCDPSIHLAEYDKEEADKLIQESLDMRERKRSLYKPTPLPVLALRHPIKEFTWKNLGESLVNMHDCISNAEPSISFSCKIDLSQHVENTNKSRDTKSDQLPLNSPVSSLSEACSSNSTSNVPASHASLQNGGLLQLATVPNGEVQSQQVDPNHIEMEVDDVPNVCNINMLPNSYTLMLPQADLQPTDLSIYNDSTSNTKRTAKRKRLLSELSEFAAKRRSTRVRNPAVKKAHDNINYQELLQKFLPSKLIGDGKYDDQDDDSDPLSQDKASGDHTYGQSAENEKKDNSKVAIDSSYLSSTEKDDVTHFIANNQSNGGIIDLLYNYTVCLAKKNHFVWPKNLIDVYCAAFCRLRNHITTPNIFSHETECLRIKEIGMAILVYCEFKVDQWYLSTGHSMSFSPKVPSNNSFQSSPCRVGNDFHSDMEFLVQLTVRMDVLGKDWLNFTVRALWLKAKFHSLEGEIDLAVCCIGKLSDVLCDLEEKPPKTVVQNCSFSNVITADNVQQQLESLQRCQSLEEVQRLYEHGDYTAVVDLLILTFNQPRTKRKQSLDGVPERHAQLLLLQNSLWKLERYKDCVFWSEVSFNEALQQFMNAARSDWSETMAHLLSGLDKCAKLDPNYLSGLDDSKLVRLTQNLILVIVIQMENYDFSADNAALLIVLPWIILYRLILNEERRKSKRSQTVAGKSTAVEIGSAGNSSNKTGVTNFLTDFDLSASMPSSLMLLFTAHEYLGRRSWCTAADGLLLLHCIDVMMAELQDTKGNSYLYREDLETGLEQCIYCLYGHPNKRTRAKHLQEHNAKQIPLTWERAVLIFQYFKPNILPEFDSYRTSTVSAELENLLKRISALVPPEEDPATKVDNYTAYIEGGTDKCPDPPFGNKTPSSVVKDLYYLLGDYYFKNKEFSKAIRFYLLDICINPDRQDSWAGMALSRSSQLDQKLNSYELRNESTIYRKSSAALKCFEHALELDPTTTSLWIEYGSLAYILHSHASRQLKQETYCDELYELLQKKKLEMLEVAERCFRAANHCDDGGEPEEAWLHHYMLGKISEKKRDGPEVYLEHYKKALMYLHEDFARYPPKISYHNPLEFSIEVLEVYYRVHASCLKFLWRHENTGVDMKTLKVILECLLAVSQSPFANFQEKCKKEISYSSSPVPSEAEEYEIHGPIAIESLTKTDHNYYGDVEKMPKKITEGSGARQSRPSTDSSSESEDTALVKEIVDTLVGVVAERFIDEEKEKCNKESISHNMQVTNLDLNGDLSKISVESVAEESVYTTKQLYDIEGFDKEAENISHNQISALDESPTVTEEKDDFAKLEQLALELETEAAACKIVEEMLQDDELMESCDPHFQDQNILLQPENYVINYEYDTPSPSINEMPNVTESDNNEILSTMSSILTSVEISEAIHSDIEMHDDILKENRSEEKIDDAYAEKISVGMKCEFIEESKKDIKVSNENFYLPNVIDISNRDQTEMAIASILNTESNVQSMDDFHYQEMEVNDLENINSVNVRNIEVEASLNVNNPATYDSVSKNDVETLESENIQTLKENSNAITHVAQSYEVKEETGGSPSEVYSDITTNNTSVNKADKVNDTCSGDVLSKTVTDSPNAEKPSNDTVPSTLPPTPEELEKSLTEISKLIPICLDAMRECLQRFIQHYKSLYRMAHYYCHSTKNKNLSWAREILLAATPPTKKYQSLPGLFAERKNTNFFNGIWRAPSNEIDRPGSFGAHMYRSVHLLIEVLTQQKDYNMLVLLTQQLYRTPDLGKKYMRDTDRVNLVREAYDSCVNILRGQLNTLLQEEPPPEESRLICCLLEIYRSCQTLLKSGIYVDETNELLVEAYTMYRIGEVDPHPSVLEQATKFCQLQLGKSYPGIHDSFKTNSSKYSTMTELNENNMNVSMPSASAYTPDAWQKEFTKSLMLPVIPCEARVKSDIKAVQDPLILIPLDTKFNNHVVQKTSISQCSVVASQMVHVEKPKAENLQACSVAFLPVTPVFSKETVNVPNTLQGTSLLSCQAFECFDVLTTIMQASGYKVAQSSATQATDSVTSSNMQNIAVSEQGRQSFQYEGQLKPWKTWAVKTKRQKRRASSQRIEGLNLCKRLSTKPIVSSTIANSIAKLKIDGVMTTSKKSDKTQCSPLPLLKSNLEGDKYDLQAKKSISCLENNDCNKTNIPYLCQQNETSPESKLAVTDETKSCSFTKDFSLSDEDEKVSSKLEKSDNDADKDSFMSSQLETSIEKHAKEVLEFINQKVEDIVSGMNSPTELKISKSGPSMLTKDMNNDQFSSVVEKESVVDEKSVSVNTEMLTNSVSLSIENDQLYDVSKETNSVLGNNEVIQNSTSDAVKNTLSD